MWSSWSSNFIDWSVIWLANLFLNIHDCDLFDFLALVMSFKKDYQVRVNNGYMFVNLMLPLLLHLLDQKFHFFFREKLELSRNWVVCIMCHCFHCCNSNVCHLLVFQERQRKEEWLITIVFFKWNPSVSNNLCVLYF